MEPNNLVSLVIDSRERIASLSSDISELKERISELESRNSQNSHHYANSTQPSDLDSIASGIGARIVDHYSVHLEPMALSDISRVFNKRLRRIPVDEIIHRYLKDFYVLETHKKKRFVFPPGEFEALSPKLQEHWREFGMTEHEIKKSREQREKMAALYDETAVNTDLAAALEAESGS